MHDRTTSRRDFGRPECHALPASAFNAVCRVNDSFISLISGQRRGAIASAARLVLRVCSLGYRAIIRLRNHYYSTIAMPFWLDVPVISVGNLTVGGTGKTPMTLWICRQLLARGRKPAVLSRGYKASREGQADELMMITRLCPEAIAVAHSDRRAAGRLAVSEYGARAAVLDDGFQHRKMGRDLDILLVDATRPFGFGHLLPRGLLREPIGSLRRAGAVVITRCDQAAPEEIARIESTIRWHQHDMVIVRAVHRPVGFVNLAGHEAPAPSGGHVGTLAGIARPEAFERTLADAGVTIADRMRFPDHHVYTDTDAKRINEWARSAGLDAVVTTEKDAVKLERLQARWLVPILTLRVEIDLLDGGDKMVGDLIDEVLRDFDDGEPRTSHTQEV